MIRRPPRSTLFPYTTLFRSLRHRSCTQDFQQHDFIHSAIPILAGPTAQMPPDRKSTRLNSSHLVISYAVFCLKKKNTYIPTLSHLKTLILALNNNLEITHTQ